MSDPSKQSNKANEDTNVSSSQGLASAVKAASAKADDNTRKAGKPVNDPPQEGNYVAPVKEYINPNELTTSEERIFETPESIAAKKLEEERAAKAGQPQIAPHLSGEKNPAGAPFRSGREVRDESLTPPGGGSARLGAEMQAGKAALSRKFGDEQTRREQSTGSRAAQTSAEREAASKEAQKEK